MAKDLVVEEEFQGKCKSNRQMMELREESRRKEQGDVVLYNIFVDDDGDVVVDVVVDVFDWN